MEGSERIKVSEEEEIPDVGDVCTCEPCECDLSDSPFQQPANQDRSSRLFTEADLCTCNPCECDASENPYLNPPSQKVSTEEEAGQCTCDPCECDVSDNPFLKQLAEKTITKDYKECDLCTCNPCECDPSDNPDQGKLAQLLGSRDFTQEDLCTCDPCECDVSENPYLQQAVLQTRCLLSGEKEYCESKDAPIPKKKSTWAQDEGDACTCDPCECELPDPESESPPQRFSYTLPPTPVPSDHTFENLDRLRKNYCRKIYPANLGQELTEDVLVNILVKNPYGELEMKLPGNQIYPGYLKQRIHDEDIPTIVNVLLEVRGITKVILSYNEIADKGIEILAPALQECANIIEVNLMQNNITSRGVLSLCNALMHRSPLHSLRLTGMKIGDEGMRALTCLILSGRSPYDLDIGECDLTVEGFQTLCSALHAMDHDIDYPSYLLLKNNLPMELVRLKVSKAEYNEEVGHITALNRKISQPTFVRVKEDLNFEPTACSKPKQSDLHELFETFSATILQGLFDLRHRFNEDDLNCKDVLDDPCYQPLRPSSSMILADVEKIIEKFNQFRTGDNYDNSDGNEIQLVSHSLYSLEVVDEELLGCSELSHREEYTEENMRDEMAHPPDSYTAEAAATHVVREAMYTASKHVATSDYKEGSDVTQLILLTVLETIDKIHAGVHLTEDDCQRILEDAIEKTYRFIFPVMPSESTLSAEDISCFFKVLFNISHGTFFQLFENEYIIQALTEKGYAVNNATCTIPQQKFAKQGAMTFQQIRQIAVSFLHGIFSEAARVIGVASPFGLEENPEDAIIRSVQPTECDIEGAFDAVIQTAAAFAVATKQKAHGIQETTSDYNMAADQFVIDLFENVNKMVVETDMRRTVSETDSTAGPTTYKFVSRPTRLVFNRPMFGTNSAIMGAKLGDYLGTNTSVTALHIQKWSLNEEGMIAFMEPFMTNTTLVTLDLACNQLAADGMKLLGLYLGKNQNLKHLILSNNRIRDAGMAFLNAGIPQSSLVSLDIANNDITYRELDVLLTTLPTSRIRALYMWGNKFGQDSWKILKILYEERILTTAYTDVVLQKFDNQRVIVKNMQIRDTNEYYEVPAVAACGLRLPPSYADTSSRLKNKATTSALSLKP